MGRFGRGYDRDAGGRGPSRWEARGDFGSRYDRDLGYNRPRVGGYDEGYRFASGRGRMGESGATPRYGGDYWWLGEHNHRSRGGSQGYDRTYAEFDRWARPRYSPVGGMHPAMGGSYLQHRSPRELRDPRWFSEWTRWF